MTIFEYLAVAVSIVLSLGAVRLLDGLPHATASGRRYWPHTAWVVALLWFHVHFWWVFWSYRSVDDWRYPEFLLALAAPGLLYSAANTLVSASPATMTSWQEHFARTRRRFFLLLVGCMLAIAFSGWLIVGIPLRHPVRAVQALAISLALGALSDHPRLQRILPLIALAGFVILTVRLALGPLVPMKE